MDVVALVGSLRKDSYNLKLAKTMQERYANRFTLRIADIGHLPLYNPDDESSSPESVALLKQLVKEADAVIVITAEYNWSIPGSLKNALDWISRGDRELRGKPVMTAGVTPTALGTVRAQMHLREILSSPGMWGRIMPPGGNEVLINFAEPKFDAATGRLTDEVTLEFLDGVVDRFLHFCAEVRP